LLNRAVQIADRGFFDTEPSRLTLRLAGSIAECQRQREYGQDPEAPYFGHAPHRVRCSHGTEIKDRRTIQQEFHGHAGRSAAAGRSGPESRLIRATEVNPSGPPEVPVETRKSHPFKNVDRSRRSTPVQGRLGPTPAPGSHLLGCFGECVSGSLGRLRAWLAQS